MTGAHQRIGILGGTFDPVHAGHVAAARAAIECAHLHRVIFIPAGEPPHRPAAAAPAEDRLEMCRLATADEPHFDLSDSEVRRAGPSYTVDTLVELKTQHPGDELFLILGWDAASQFNTWLQPAQVRALASIVVIGRPGQESPRVEDLEAAGLGGDDVVLCLKRTPEISASDLRRAVGAGDSISGKVPVAVERYIAGHRLYAG